MVRVPARCLATGRAYFGPVHVQSAPGSGPGPKLALAVDIGGTKVAAGLVTADGEVVTRATVPTPLPANQDAEGMFSTVLALCDAVGGDGEVVVCGVGCGGPMTRGGESVSPLNIPAWRGFPLRSRVAEHTQLPTWVDNDAKALALAEGWLGAAAGEADFIAMVVSTGVGGGIVSDGGAGGGPPRTPRPP